MISFSKSSLLLLLQQLSGNGIEAFVPSSLGKSGHIIHPLKVATEPTVVTVISDDDDGPDHMPEFQDIAVSFYFIIKYWHVCYISIVAYYIIYNIC